MLTWANGKYSLPSFKRLFIVCSSRSLLLEYEKVKLFINTGHWGFKLFIASIVCKAYFYPCMIENQMSYIAITWKEWRTKWEWEKIMVVYLRYLCWKCWKCWIFLTSNKLSFIKQKGYSANINQASINKLVSEIFVNYRLPWSSGIQSAGVAVTVDRYFHPLFVWRMPKMCSKAC